jgi:hypothetical protein
MEFASLANQFGPWVGLLIYAAIAFFRERERREEREAKAHEAHLADIRANNTENKAAVAAIVSVVGELKELRREVRSFDRDSDPEDVPPSPASKRGGR